MSVTSVRALSTARASLESNSSENPGNCGTTAPDGRLLKLVAKLPDWKNHCRP